MVDKPVAAHDGQAPLSRAVAKVVIDHHAAHENHERPQFDREKVLKAFGMGKREWEVLRHLIQGYPIVEIGRRLSISHHTVNQHLRSVYRKLGVKSRAMAANAARVCGLIDE